MVEEILPRMRVSTLAPSSLTCTLIDAHGDYGCKGGAKASGH